MPVWPICFCSCWPMPAPAAMRLPAASTPMSFMDTPASASAAWAASEARSIVSLSGCFPNLVMWMPRIQTSSAMSVRLQRGEPEADGLGAGAVGADRERGELDLHAQRDVLGIGLDPDEVAPHAGAVAVDDRGDEGHRDAGGGHRHDGERPDLALGGDGHRAEVLPAARRTGVAAIEEPGTAGGALVRLQVRVVAQHQVVDQGYLSSHALSVL